MTPQKRDEDVHIPLCKYFQNLRKPYVFQTSHCESCAAYTEYLENPQGLNQHHQNHQISIDLGDVG